MTDGGLDLASYRRALVVENKTFLIRAKHILTKRVSLPPEVVHLYQTMCIIFYLFNWSSIRPTYRVGRIQIILNVRLTEIDLHSLHPTLCNVF